MLILYHAQRHSQPKSAHFSQIPVVSNVGVQAWPTAEKRLTPIINTTDMLEFVKREFH
jgi:hypothetical protein